MAADLGVFAHDGVLHLVINAFGLVVLGRLAEEMFGAVRMIAIFAVAGVIGATASYLASPAGTSAGASGAVFGLLGAVLTEITWHRARYRMAWKRGLWGGLAVVAVSQFGYGFLSSAIDQWAHGGGLIAGAVMGAVLSPTARWARAGTMIARGLAIGFAAAAAIAGVLVVRTSIADSPPRRGLERHVVQGVAIEAPADWVERDEPVPARRRPRRRPRGPARPARRPRDRRRDAAGRAGGAARVVERSQPAPALDRRSAHPDQGAVRCRRRQARRQPLIALPTGWDGDELAIAPRMRWAIASRCAWSCSRNFGASMVFVAIYVPETIAAAAPGSSRSCSPRSTGLNTGRVPVVRSTCSRRCARRHDRRRASR